MFDPKLGLVWNVFVFSLVGGFVYGFHHMKYVTGRSYQINDHPNIQKFIDELAEKEEQKNQLNKKPQITEFVRLTKDQKNQNLIPDIQ